MGVFSKNNQPETDVKRNAFDGSFQNNLTMKMGYLYPCFCKEVISGDTFRIKPAFGLRFMPTAFPLQTKIKAHLDLFYVRNRNLWKYWSNYFTQVGPHDGFPVLSPSEAVEQLRTGSLGDYLGLPSTLVGSGTPVVSAVPYYPDYSRGDEVDFQLSVPSPDNSAKRVVLQNSNLSSRDAQVQFMSFVDPRQDFGAVAVRSGVYSFSPADLTEKLPSEDVKYENFRRLPFLTPPTELINALSIATNPRLRMVWCRVDDYGDNYIYDGQFFDDRDILVYGNSIYVNLQGFTSIDLTENVLISFVMSDFSQMPFKNVSFEQLGTSSQYVYKINSIPAITSVVGESSTVLEAMDVLKTSPFEISALPFRAYEQIYNSFYRDDRNNPLYVDGVFDPNRFLPNEDGGSDSTPYRLYKRNWEQDFLTTAMTSPQFGQAPLVGLTSTGVASFQDEDGNIVTSQLQTDADGDTVVGFSSTSSPSVNSTLIKLSSTGFSINDFRGVNALQRYLETKMRFGLRYRDQIRSHFGVNIKQEILDMPEFIGSVSQMVDVSQINQTAPVGDDPLGSFAGQLSCVGGRNGGFQKYCDEPGYIIGIISIVPVPSYSQLCPKHFLKTHEALDYYHPEFAHLGMQPIKYDEVCPLQASNQGVPLNETFGYQRAWYDYLSSVDEIHGDFRTTLNHFLLTRVFNSLPSINPEFLTVDPDSMNQVFTVNQVNGKPVDTILGQLHFDVTMMRPISRFGVPRLE